MQAGRLREVTKSLLTQKVVVAATDKKQTGEGHERKPGLNQTMNGLRSSAIEPIKKQQGWVESGDSRVIIKQKQV